MSRALESGLNAPSAGAVMKRVGGVLLAVGLADVGVTAWCLVRGLDYASGFGFFAVIVVLSGCPAFWCFWEMLGKVKWSR